MLANCPNGAKDIWQTYKDHQVADAGGNIADSFKWWITGQTNGDAFESTDGFFFDYLSSYATVELENGTDPAAFVKGLEENCNLRWNICVEAGQKAAGAIGNKVFFVMCP